MSAFIHCLSDEEYKQLDADSKQRGIKAQQLLRTMYFDSNQGLPLMPKEECEKVLLELKRIGININQIAKQANSGFRYGLSDSLEDAVPELARIRRKVVNNVAA